MESKSEEIKNDKEKCFICKKNPLNRHVKSKNKEKFSSKFCISCYLAGANISTVYNENDYLSD